MSHKASDYALIYAVLDILRLDVDLSNVTFMVELFNEGGSRHVYSIEEDRHFIVVSNTIPWMSDSWAYVLVRLLTIVHLVQQDVLHIVGKDVYEMGGVVYSAALGDLKKAPWNTLGIRYASMLQTEKIVMVS